MNPTRLLTALLSLATVGFAEPVKVATFDVDATPPLGSAMAYDPVKRLDDLTLRCRGVVITGSGEPIVLCAVDWIGIANEGHDAFRAALEIENADPATLTERIDVPLTVTRFTRGDVPASQTDANSGLAVSVRPVSSVTTPSPL